MTAILKMTGIFDKFQTKKNVPSVDSDRLRTRGAAEPASALFAFFQQTPSDHRKIESLEIRNS